MSNVTRYFLHRYDFADAEMEVDSDGDYVFYTDYEALNNYNS